MKNSRFKKIMIGSSVAALLGGSLSSYFGPKAIAWYFDPPVDIGVNCRQAVEWSMLRLQITQLVGLAAGFALGIAVMIWLTGRNGPDIEI